jgi:hypothetical protein
MKKRCCSSILLLFLLAACGKEEVTVYQIPKEEATPAVAVRAANPDRKITWTAPKEWQEQPATQMRQGSFLVSGSNGVKADISVTGFPGDAGGDLANVNRWRGQINLTPFDEAAMQGIAKQIDIGGEPAAEFTLDEKSDGSGRKIVAVILHHGGETWFFKMMGDSALVTTQQNGFADFLKSVRFPATETAAAPMEASAAPFADSSAPPPLAAAPLVSKPKWTLPPGWQEQSAGGMREGSFLVVEGGNKADVSVVTLNGEAGGILSNINRWRGQLSLPDITGEEIESLTTKIPVNGDTAAVVDIVSEAPAPDTKVRNRILGAIIERGGNTWFIKMTGEDSLVEKHKPDFLDFLKSLQLP